MKNQPNAFFFETQPIPDDTIIFEELKKQELFFSYFQVDQNYYLFFYSQKSIDIDTDLIDPFILEELDTKQRKIRSLRGFFLYALETMENGKDFEILTTNLKPFFWRKVKNILRQNKKSALQEFLFGSQDSIAAIEPENNFEARIENLQNQLDSLQEKVMNLESQTNHLKDALRGTLDAPDATKIIQQGDSTLKDKNGSSLAQNDRQVRDPTYREKEMESKSFSEIHNIEAP